MEKELILLSEYCNNSRAELDFILSLENEGLIETEVYGNDKYLKSKQLDSLEMFSRLHYDLSVNVAGIDIIHNLLNKMQAMHQELFTLRRHFNDDSFFEDDFFDIF